MTRAFTENEIAGLIERLKAATGPDTAIDDMIARLEGYRGLPLPATGYTASIDAALTLVPEGCNYLIGRGRTRPDEPVFGAILFSGPYSDNEKEMGEGESDISLSIALCIAALKARASIRASGTRPTGEPGVTSPPAQEASGPVGRGLAEGEVL